MIESPYMLAYQAGIKLATVNFMSKLAGDKKPTAESDDTVEEEQGGENQEQDEPDPEPRVYTVKGKGADSNYKKLLNNIRKQYSDAGLDGLTYQQLANRLGQQTLKAGDKLDIDALLNLRDTSTPSGFTENVDGSYAEPYHRDSNINPGKYEEVDRKPLPKKLQVRQIKRPQVAAPAAEPTAPAPAPAQQQQPQPQAQTQQQPTSPFYTVQKDDTTYNRIAKHMGLNISGRDLARYMQNRNLRVGDQINQDELLRSIDAGATANSGNRSINLYPGHTGNVYRAGQQVTRSALPPRRPVATPRPYMTSELQSQIRGVSTSPIPNIPAGNVGNNSPKPIPPIGAPGTPRAQVPSMIRPSVGQRIVDGLSAVAPGNPNFIPGGFNI